MSNDNASRVVLVTVDDAGAYQTAVCNGLVGERFDNIDRLQNYGFTSQPLPGCKGVVVMANGSRDNAIIVATDDGKYRLSLQPGDVAVYDNRQQSIVMSDEGITVEAPRGLYVNGDIYHTGNTTHTGMVTVTQDVIAGGDQLSMLQHTHDQPADNDSDGQKPVDSPRNP